ncbi:hypothetical protein BG004_001925 [Podila humilis]|nr:hypothetical protein BG004_001925 [Podila humilis]
MNFPSLLSDHEQRAFSEFLNQLAQEDTSGQPKPEGQNGPPPVDPSLTQQQQQQLQLQLQHHLHLRHLQQQHQQQQQLQQSQPPLPPSPLGHLGGTPSLPRLPSLMMPSDQSPQQQALAQQQRDWIQQISSNPLLAPGGVINPHAMSQAMLQNPLLMAQANAISQAMVLAQQQQLQMQMQQQQQQQQQEQLMQQQQQHQQHQQHMQQHQHQQHQQQQQQQQHQQQIHNSYALQQQQQSMPPPFHPPPSQQPQHHSQQQHHQHQQHQSHQQPQSQQNHDFSQRSASLSNGDRNDSTPPSKNAKSSSKRKSKTDSVTSAKDTNTSRSSSPYGTQALQNGHHHSSSDPILTSFGSKNTMEIGNGSTELALDSSSTKQESDMEGEPSPLPKKTVRRKGSTARSASMDGSMTSGLVAKSAHRTSRDGFDPLQGANRRKVKTEIKDSPSQQIDSQSSRDSMDGSEEPSNGNGNSNGNGSISSSKDAKKENSPTTNDSPLAKTKKPHHELLTEAEKKANHIASEQKRRQNIRVGFDSLVEIVPTLSDCHRSEAVILQKSVDYIHRLLNQKSELKTRVRELQANLGDTLDDIESETEMDFEQD